MPSVPLVPFENTPYSDPIYPGIPVPPENPQDDPQACLTYNANWQPILVALASRLTRYDAWLGDLNEQKLGVRKAHELIARIQQEFCPEGIPEDLCTNFAMENPFTSYFPGNPFTAPEFVPSGYNRPPFYTNVTNILFDIRPTDVIVDILGLNPGMTLEELIGFSFPRIHIDLEGTGECEIEFLQLLQGGFCTVTIDGNPFQAKIIDLNAINLTDIQSILSLIGVLFTGGAANRFVHEIQFETIGDHTIDIVFYPHIAGEAIFGFGGGVGRIGFCSTSLDGDMRYMPVSGIRLNTETCMWQQEFNGDGVWIDYAPVFVPECMPAQGALVRDPGDGQLEQSLDGGTVWEDILNAHFLHINADNDPLTSGLSINGSSDMVQLEVQAFGASFQNNKLMSFKDGNGIERAWVNPRGQASFSTGGAPGNPALTLVQGGMLIDNNEKVVIKSFAGAQENLIFVDVNNTMQWKSRNGWIFSDVAGNILHSGVNGIYLTANPVAGGRTLWFLRGGPNQGTNILANFQQSDGTALVNINADGRIDEFVRDTGTNNVRDALILDHETSATPVNGFGTAMRLRAESSTTPSQEQVLITSSWKEAAHATRKAQMAIHVFDTAQRTLINGEATGTQSAIGFLGAVPVPRQNISGSAEGNQLLFDLVAALSQYGLLNVTGVYLGVSCCEQAPCWEWDFTDGECGDLVGNAPRPWYVPPGESGCLFNQGLYVSSVSSPQTEEWWCREDLSAAQSLEIDVINGGTTPSQIILYAVEAGSGFQTQIIPQTNVTGVQTLTANDLSMASGGLRLLGQDDDAGSTIIPRIRVFSEVQPNGTAACP